MNLGEDDPHPPTRSRSSPPRGRHLPPGSLTQAPPLKLLSPRDDYPSAHPLKVEPSAWTAPSPRVADANAPAQDPVELPRFRGHFILWIIGVPDAEDPSPVQSRVPETDGGVGAIRSHSRGVVARV